MPKNRWLKPFYFKLEALADAESYYKLPLRYALLGLMTCCDREGRFAWRPRELKTAILPYDKIDFSRVLDALRNAGFIKQYWQKNNVFQGDYAYGCIVGWRRYQTIHYRETYSLIPSLDKTPYKLPARFTPPTKIIVNSLADKQ